MSKTSNKPAAPKSITITIDIVPPQKGQRQIIVSGAPAGEMPIVHTGAFAELHTLINTTWAELQRREPQVPVISTKAEAVKATTDDAVEDTKEDDGEVPSDTRYQTPTVIENDQLVVSAEQGLPTIAGDTVTNVATDGAVSETSLTPLEAAIEAAQQETHG